MLTPEGLQRIWEIVARQSDDSIKGGAIVVTDGTDSHSATIEEATVTLEGDTASLVVAGTFSEDEGNFEWTNRQVVTAQGTVLDEDSEDGGRKAQGSVWSIEVSLDLAADDGNSN